MNEPTILDTFSGIAGFAYAFEHCGFQCIGFSEIEPYPCQIIAKHFPGVPNFGDISTINAGQIKRPNVLTGGVPCQPASIAGERRGEDDERWLWPEALRLLRELQPDFALFENPTGILSLCGGHAFERILCQIHEAGYDVWWETIPACAVGADHRRERVFIVSHLANHRCRQTGPRESATSDQSVNTNAPSLGRDGWGQEVGDLEESKEDYWWRMREFEGLSELTPDTYGQGLEKRESKSGDNGQKQPAIVRSDWLETPETDFSLLREVHGISTELHRSERIKALGNSVVPQVIACFAQALRLFYP